MLYQVSACIIPSRIPFTKANHMTRTRIRMRETYKVKTIRGVDPEIGGN